MLLIPKVLSSSYHPIICFEKNFKCFLYMLILVIDFGIHRADKSLLTFVHKVMPFLCCAYLFDAF